DCTSDVCSSDLVDLPHLCLPWWPRCLLSASIDLWITGAYETPHGVGRTNGMPLDYPRNRSDYETTHERSSYQLRKTPATPYAVPPTSSRASILPLGCGRRGRCTRSSGIY